MDCLIQAECINCNVKAGRIIQSGRQAARQTFRQAGRITRTRGWAACKTYLTGSLHTHSSKGMTQWAGLSILSGMYKHKITGTTCT